MTYILFFAPVFGFFQKGQRKDSVLLWNETIRNRITLIGCPKLDDGEYTEKLTEIIKNNDIKSVTIARMEVPCCGGIEYAAKSALQSSGKFIPWQVITISTDGKILR